MSDGRILFSRSTDRLSVRWKIGFFYLYGKIFQGLERRYFLEKRYTIGEISHITGVSKDTLRYYDRIGVFKPEYVDPENQYRY